MFFMFFLKVIDVVHPFHLLFERREFNMDSGWKAYITARYSKVSFLFLHSSLSARYFGRMIVHFETQPTQLRFRFPFRIAHGMRTHTESVLVHATAGDFSAWGEATLPPYLPDTLESVLEFLKHPFFSAISIDTNPAEVYKQMDSLYSGNMPAKAAVDMALWNLHAQSKGISLQEALGVSSSHAVPHSYTIGIGNKAEMEERIRYGEAHGFSFFKLKLDGTNDLDILNNYFNLCSHSFAVDANQAWTSLSETEVMQRVRLLEEKHCVLLEQPFDKRDRHRTKWLKYHTQIPIIADEVCQRLHDIHELKDCFDGINIKLQKCGGLTEAKHMIEVARSLDMKVLIGCMSESAIGCDAGEALAPLCDWADLDGRYLILNNQEL
jgi:L-alanine-DL-glutamate epimerase-like enolase superfamily enzyme